ncbi:hypothetical protein K438DRAFT_1858745 [Mycena galopus ATCC 62051]|nr:hypothetical protein K438DRAFT_1896387 [Mycena galopus ATCC 62051]KAF8133120.1 hypothetical protein K438DRAFT_1884355 [Mycena galopus ATCC 62051]KAF8162530.1 hypothetical protein K438DRAFT_1858745 [Mycena galopus ATCC 62051]
MRFLWSFGSCNACCISQCLGLALSRKEGRLAPYIRAVVLKIFHSTRASVWGLFQPQRLSRKTSPKARACLIEYWPRKCRNVPGRAAWQGVGKTRRAG